jgi:LmbE family N-acetylglucosaminyl deacetylase
MTDTRVVLHVSPHPDDEAIAAGMTLSALAGRGWRVVNLLLSAGRPGDEPRRLAEAEEAARRGGYLLEVDADIPAAIDRHRPTLVISPQPHDGHPTHETVGRAVRDALERMPLPPTWWMWGLWADLAVPTLYLPFGEAELAAAIQVLEAYAGELDRNDYRRVVRGRATSNSVLGSERVFGFGTAAASPEPYAELLTEAVWHGGHWYAGARRVVDLDSPLGDSSTSTEPLDDWISDRRT